MKRKGRSLDDLKQLVINDNVHAFYVSSYWKRKRIEILTRDNYECQRCNGNFVIEGRPVQKKKITKAKYVHHVVALKDDFNRALDDDNLISLCFECHEIVEGRIFNRFKCKKKPLTEEWW